MVVFTGEKKMFQTLTKRGFVSTREAVKMITEDKVSRNLTTDSLIENHIRVKIYTVLIYLVY